MYYIFGHTINIFMLKINATRKIPYTNLVNNFKCNKSYGIVMVVIKKPCFTEQKILNLILLYSDLFLRPSCSHLIEKKLIILLWLVI